MSLLRACVSSIPLAFGLACAASPKTASPPQCEEPQPTIVVSDPAIRPPSVTVPSQPELVSMRLFVVSGSGDGVDENLPESIRESPTCASDGCTLLLSPMLLGRSNGEMELEVGTHANDNLFSLEARPRLSNEHVELKLEAQLAVKSEASRSPSHRLRFEGLLEPGVLTHVGTFHAEDHRGHTVGPQVFVMVERAEGTQG